MDLLLFPSRHEELGTVAIETQIRGLRVLASTNVPVEAKISDSIEFLNLATGTWAWAEAALHPTERIKLQEENVASYDIHIQAKELEIFYGKNRNAKR